MQNWQGTEECVALAETLSFKLAAERLNLSSAQVSRQISALEARLDAKLFYRTTRQVTLTEAGEIYYRHCRQLLDGIKDAQNAISELQGSPQGLLRMTAPIVLGEQVISPLMNQFLIKNPQLKLWLQLSDQAEDLLSSGFDLAIRVGTLGNSNMIAKKLSERQLVLVASPDYTKKHGFPETLEQLSEHNCLSRLHQSWQFMSEGKQINVKPAGTLKVNSGLALQNAVLQGMGITQLPDSYVNKYIDSGDLIPLLDSYKPPKDGIWALYPYNRQLSPKVKCVIEFLSKSMLELGY